ncbi:MAG: rhodanese-like domain-containing protein [Coriobacteriales bacterium]|jgi:rhodanese-related sulfurtransferase|nr:rhodanese-like domain-containing protein [Coriobacteriales bacterium]
MSRYQKITAEDAKKMMDSGEPFILLDVRTEKEFQEKHINGAVLIPHDEIMRRAGSELSDKDALILLYCRSGRKSKFVAEGLLELGYSRVYDFGGILNWPYETVKGTAAYEGGTAK